MVDLAPISQRIWDMKYRLKQADGTPVDESVEDTWKRVAGALAEAEQPGDRAAWAEAFYRAMEGFRVMPAGRIVAGAGADRDVTLFNCFVMGTVPDTMDGIFAHLREAALTMQQGGGIGYDFSTLRPRGAPVRGVGSDASGPVSFMDVWDSMCRTIMSAGSRRGAMMGCLRCDHPDIEEFVDAKQDAERLRMFNVSVLATDAFMQAVREDADWPLVFEGQTYRTVKARRLWNRIMRATYDAAEPGVIFIDRINQKNNMWYAEEIAATNPCVTAGTWVHTAHGPRQVRDLVGRPFIARVDGADWASDARGFFETGRKPVLKLACARGPALRLTADHPVLRVRRRTRYVRETEWVAAGDLNPGDELVLNDHRAGADWPGEGTAEEGYLIGLLLGDGTLKQDKAVLSVWRPATAVNGGHEGTGADAVMAHAASCARTFQTRSDFAGWQAVAGRDEYRLALGGLKDLAHTLGLAPGAKHITPAIEARGSAFVRGVLGGLFDTDGTVGGTQTKGVSVRLAQSDPEDLRAVQRMLLRLGIASSLYTDRRPAGAARLPDGRGGSRLYPTRAQHELVIAGENLARFAAEIGFRDTDKQARLDARLAGYRRRLNRESWTATVTAVEPDGEACVYDCAIPGRNAFDANGLVVHNCGEQPLPPYGACLLGSINLARLVDKPFAAEARLDTDALAELTRTAVRMLDNAIDVSRFPLDAQRREAYDKRRIGLGVTGLADALAMVGLTYGAQDAVAATEQWMATLQRHAYLASADLAREKGAFPLFDADQYLAGETIRQLDADVRRAIADKGMRNALVTSVAPTGTISLFADNVSSGLEPIFSFAYTRNVLEPDGSRSRETVQDYAVRLYRQIHGEQAELPASFVDAQTLSPSAHLVMQAAVQKYVDSSVSKTINLPEEISFEAFKDVYLQAYDMGCKGCTTYRPNPVTGAVLETSGGPEDAAQAAGQEASAAATSAGDPAPARQPAAAEGGDASVVYMTQPLDRPEVLPGRTYKLKWPESDHALYITLNDVVQDGRRRPFEIFINSKNMEHYAWTVALTRMISAVFRRGGDVSFVVEELKAVFDPRGGAWLHGSYKPSLLAAIGEVIEQHMIDIGFLPDRRNIAGEKAQQALRQAVGAAPPRQCQRCGQAAVVHQEGCDICTACGHSTCA
jgi:ribonucleoside-diphosphate reductase alpha chain